MVMRWKILEMAEQCASLNDLLHQLENHPEYGLPKESGLKLLLQYADILPEHLRAELHEQENTG